MYTTVVRTSVLPRAVQCQFHRSLRSVQQVNNRYTSKHDTSSMARVAGTATTSFMSADTSATPHDYYDIIVIGRTGGGKSTLGNKLLQVSTSRTPPTEYSTQFADGQGSRDHDNPFVGFLTADSVERKKQSVTMVCQLVANENTKVRVLDTPGFFSSRTPVDNIYRDNLQIFRDIVRVQLDPNNHLQVRRVLYFLPGRGVLEKADGAICQELQVMYRFFGSDVFDHMVLILTQEIRCENQGMQFNAVDLADIQDTFREAVTQVTDKEYTNCPPVVHIGFNDRDDDVLRKIQENHLLPHEKIFIPACRDGTCFRCSGLITYATPQIKGKKGREPVSILVGDVLETYSKSKCHPRLIPKYTMTKKCIGTIGHAATIGIPYAIGKFALHKEVSWPWPGLLNSEEICLHCKNSSKHPPCFDVYTTFKLKGHEDIKVDHSNKL